MLINLALTDWNTNQRAELGKNFPGFAFRFGQISWRHCHVILRHISRQHNPISIENHASLGCDADNTRAVCFGLCLVFLPIDDLIVEKLGDVVNKNRGYD